MSTVAKKVLIVEHDPRIREELCGCLERDRSNEYSFREFSRPTDGIDAYVSWQPDCVLVGLEHPDATGLEVLQQLRERTGRVAIPMVLVGTSEHLELRKTAIRAGAQELVDRSTVSGDNLCWIVSFAIEKAALHQKLERRQRQLRKANRKLKQNVLALEREIAERHRAEGAARLSTERYHSLVVASAQVVWTMDADGLVDDMPDWRAITGQTRDEVRGWGWIDAIHPDDRQLTVARWSECVQSRQEFAIEHRVKTVDGSFHVFAVRGVPVLEHDGSVREWVGTCKDVTSSRRTLELLRERDDQLRLALTAGLAGTWNWELAANELSWSDELFAVFGLDATSRDATYERFRDSIHPDDLDMVQSKLLEAIRQRQDVSLAYRIIRPGGELRWVTTRGQLFLDDYGNPVRMIGITLDITDRRLVEVEREELLARERYARAVAEMASHAKDEFLAVVSHELRAPLNAILGWARILQSRSVEEKTVVHAIDTIERSARAQSNIIDDLLDITRITSGKLRLEVRPIDLTSVMDAAIDVVRPAADAKSIELIRIYDPEIDVINGDSGRLQQVVWNLLSNAVKFTQTGGQVIVRLERIDPFVQIQVCDTGKGIDPEFLPRIFDRFNQADASSARRHGGLGLGLALARYVVEAHGGTISAESLGESKGSTFTVKLPLRAVRAEVQDPSDVAGDERVERFPPVLDGLRILVVDDERDARELVTTLLTRYGATVTPTSSCEEALIALTDAAACERFDVIVSDIGLPGEDGYSLVRKVRELTPALGGAIPAVALTAYGRSVDRVKALSAGFQMHVPKPVEPVELAMVITSLTRRASIDTVA